MKRGEHEAEKEMELTSSLKTRQSREKEMQREIRGSTQEISVPRSKIYT